MNLLLVADIGGTNARFGLVEFDPAQLKAGGKINYTAQRQITLKCANYSDMATMIKACCAELGIAIPAHGCLAIAGPIENGQASMTNLNWKFSINSLRDTLGMETLHVINDFASLAYAVPFLQDAELITLYAAKSNPDAPIVVMGPGTGFGMAGLIPSGDNWRIVPTEGGHASFAPTNSKEMRIKSYLLKEQNHVSIENILSGGGLVNLYRALAYNAGIEAETYTPADVSTKGLNNEDPLCREAVCTFCDVLGEVAGDKALSWGAKGGVVIGGGITPKLASILHDTHFFERYKNKGPMATYVSDISIRLIVNDKAALVGSAAWLIHNTPALKN
ncbi:glucokinase [Cellvibrio japonicus]|uniref:Glucokinase n=1 Tax=Cellvibrio japonicus (strain Ueda107) TaxID=498211 RepID=B3PDN6_CELJU|nr:glucokinase [Cellvibrio japonicus]ACE82860.1 glucokinase [Cellvibrio japonicus Ueda107]QEI12045.1 glucokinase [Cellvibrio japonicus]QEI15619.1 glucokinase [Cellvibrio japonicus]QEI19197.1 glucokinase [Cellvibrio japonicus]